MIEQYKILWELLESELKRFWLGFHILSVLKIASITGIFGFLKIGNNKLEIDILWAAVIFVLILLSIINILLNYRAQLLYSIISKSIKTIEKKDKHLCITETISDLSDGNISENTPHAMHIANILPIVVLNISLISGYYLFLNWGHSAF